MIGSRKSFRDRFSEEDAAAIIRGELIVSRGPCENFLLELDGVVVAPLINVVVELDALPVLELEAEVADGFRKGGYCHVVRGVEEEDVFEVTVAETLEFSLSWVKP